LFLGVGPDFFLGRLAPPVERLRGTTTYLLAFLLSSFFRRMRYRIP